MTDTSTGSPLLEKLKVLIASDPDSTHTYKWVKGLASSGIEVMLFGLSRPRKLNYDNLPGVHVSFAGIPRETTQRAAGHISKIQYIKAVPLLRKAIAEFKPDILHAHYASSYGVIAALTKFHPFALSVWGSDVYEFPDRNFLMRKSLSWTLQQADTLMSTSHVMAKRAAHFVKKPIEVIPFGVDTDVFAPYKLPRKIFSDLDFVIGTVKALAPKYGIEDLICAFSELTKKYRQEPLKLLIVGSGPQEAAMKSLVKDLGLEAKVLMSGHVDQKEVPRFLNEMDVYVALSTQDSESFGVAILEAGSCGKPVVVSDVGGLPEVVVNGTTGLVVPRNSPQKAAEALEALFLDTALRKSMGEEGRRWVQEKYAFSECVRQVINAYRHLKSSAQKSEPRNADRGEMILKPHA